MTTIISLLENVFLTMILSTIIVVDKVIVFQQWLKSLSFVLLMTIILCKVNIMHISKTVIIFNLVIIDGHMTMIMN